MAERLADQRDRCAIVDRVAGVGVAQPMRRGRGIDASAQRSCLHDEVEPALGQSAASAKHGIPVPASPRVASSLARQGDRQQHLARFLPLADQLELNLAAVARDQLPPAQRHKLGDAQRAIVGDLEHQPSRPGRRHGSGDAYRRSDISFCASWRGAFLSLMRGAALKRV